MVIAPEPDPTDSRVRELSDFKERLKDALLESGFQTWPIMRFREKASTLGHIDVAA